MSCLHDCLTNKACSKYTIHDVETHHWIRAPEWQPINTIPPEDDYLTSYLVWDGQNISLATVGYKRDCLYGVCQGRLTGDDSGLDIISATHWMPLPEPPVST